MTNPKALAEKIQEHFKKEYDFELMPSQLEYIESLLAEAVEEAILDDRMKRTADDIYKLSRESAYDRAAKVAEKMDNDVIGLHHDKIKLKAKIAAAIRGLKGGL